MFAIQGRSASSAAERGLEALVQRRRRGDAAGDFVGAPARGRARRRDLTARADVAAARFPHLTLCDRRSQYAPDKPVEARLVRLAHRAVAGTLPAAGHRPPPTAARTGSRACGSSASSSCGGGILDLRARLAMAHRHGRRRSAASARSGADASASATASAQEVRIVSSWRRQQRRGRRRFRAQQASAPANRRSRPSTWNTLMLNSSLPSADRPPAVEAAPGRLVHARRQQDAVGAASSSGISRVPWPGPFHSATTADAFSPGGRERCAMPKDVSVSTAEPGSSARTLAYRAAQRELSCGPSSSGVTTIVGPIGADDVGHVVDLGEVLAHERDERAARADVDDLDRPARDLHRLPPADVRVQRAAEVVLVDLGLIERPTVVLSLADVHPVLVGVDGRGAPSCRGTAPVRPRGWRTPVISPNTPCRASSASRSSISDSSMALSGQDDDVDAADLVASPRRASGPRGRGRALPTARTRRTAGLLARATDPGTRVEVRFSNPQRPGQQQVVDPAIVRPGRAGGRHLVPPSLDAGAVRGGVA